MKIVVLAGGTSTERDVSIVSGTNVCKALRSKGHQAILVDVYFGKEDADCETIFDGEYDVDQEVEYIKGFNDKVADTVAKNKDFFGVKVLELCKAADVVFLALHGANGEDGKVQAAFDLYHIPYTGTGYLSSAMAMDKGITKKLFSVSGVPTPKGVELIKGHCSDQLSDQGMEFPVVVKTCCGGSSVGVYITKDQKEYEEALAGAFSYENEVVVEEYIEGREFSVGVVDGEAYPVIEIAPVEGFYDYKNKYSAGAAVETCPAVLTEEQTSRMQNYAKMGCKVLGIEGYARLDFLMKENGEMYCLEANTLPGMTPTSLLPQEAAALGIDYPGLCEKLIYISLKKYE
ncbi:MAG: D-alanine--D-alanine ligase [Clostridia bacterium]|nr:D-alanine--D-alanine ligase [Clostridia bacterium]NCC42282.1 D-alanine--D-alanine ligase [Clostridia bacterium]